MFHTLHSVRGQGQANKENTKRKAETRHRDFCFLKEWFMQSLVEQEKKKSGLMPPPIFFLYNA